MTPVKLTHDGCDIEVTEHGSLTLRWPGFTCHGQWSYRHGIHRCIMNFLPDRAEHVRELNTAIRREVRRVRKAARA